MSYQHIHDLRLDDTIFEEFGSNVSESKSIDFFEKSLLWYLIRKFCKQISSTLDSEKGSRKYCNSERLHLKRSSILKELSISPSTEETMGLTSRMRLTMSL